MIPEHSTLHTRPCHSCKLLISVCNQGRTCAQGHPGRGPSRGPTTFSTPTQFQPKTFGPFLVSPVTIAATAWCLLAAAWRVARATCRESEPLARWPVSRELISWKLTLVICCSAHPSRKHQAARRRQSIFFTCLHIFSQLPSFLITIHYINIIRILD